MDLDRGREDVSFRLFHGELLSILSGFDATGGHGAGFGRSEEVLVLRAHLGEDPSFLVALKQSAATVREALDHQDFPFSLLVEQLSPARHPNRS